MNRGHPPPAWLPLGLHGFTVNQVNRRRRENPDCVTAKVFSAIA
jgi:hypothetical protein